MKTLVPVLIIFLYSAGLRISFAANIERGQELHDENCISCHAAIYGEKGNEIYTRENRKIDSLTSLQEQLERCKNSLGTNWPKDQIQDVQHYLNKNFYRFNEK